jgi:hypothetical protein
MKAYMTILGIEIILIASCLYFWFSMDCDDFACVHLLYILPFALILFGILLWGELRLIKVSFNSIEDRQRAFQTVKRITIIPMVMTGAAFTWMLIDLFVTVIR